MADERISLELFIEADKANLSLGELEEGFESLKEQLKGTARGTEEFKRLSTAIAETGREVKNIELGFEALDNEQVASELGSVAGAVGDVTAAFILMGGESETMQEMAKNIETAMAVSMGFKGAIEGVSSGMKLYNNLVKTGKLQTVLFTAAQKVAAIATRIWNALLSANPIMLVVAGVTAAVAAIALFSKETKTASREQEILNEVQEETVKGMAAEQAQMMSLVETAKNENLSKRERQKAIKELNKISPEYLGNLSLETINTQEATDALNLYTAALEKKARAKALEAKLEEAVAVQLEAEAKGTKDLVFELSQWELNTLSREEAMVRMAELRQEGIDLAKEEVDAILNVMNAEQEQAEHRGMTMGKIESSKFLEEKADKARTARKKRREDAAEERRKEFEAREDIDRVKKIDAYLEEEKVEEERANRLLFYSDMINADAKEKHEAFVARIKAEDEARQEQISKAQTGLNLISGFNEAFTKDEEKRDKIRKKLAVAQIAIDTARAISSGIAAAAGIPFPGNLVAFIPTIATILANIGQAKNILSTAGVSAGGSGSLGGAALGASSGGGGANISPVTNTSTLLGEPTQVFVTEADITATQSKVSVNEMAATF